MIAGSDYDNKVFHEALFSIPKEWSTNRKQYSEPNTELVNIFLCIGNKSLN